MASFTNVDIREINRFNKLSQAWWDPSGELGTLHTINPLRVKFILENNTITNPRILDVGCGGGILTEALANAGAQVTGIDLSQEAIQVARLHAERQGLKIEYRYTDVEEFTYQHAAAFDIVTCLEMLEHVPDPKIIIQSCSQALRPGGQAFFSTINRTLKAFFFAILAGEYVLHLLPAGSHKYSRLIRPKELIAWASKADLSFIRFASLMYNPILRSFRLAPDRADVNYLAQLSKRV